MSSKLFRRSSALVLISALVLPGWAQSPEKRARLRELGIRIGQLPTGRYNAITDVDGVLVGHVTLSRGDGPLKPGHGPVRTGVTVILPRRDFWHQKSPAGFHVLNGTGEMTGLVWVAESGILEYPIVLTNTLNVGRVYDGVIEYMLRRWPEIGVTDVTLNPVVAECDDQFLNDIQGRHVQPGDVVRAIEQAAGGPVAEGAVGAGTGMVAYGFKGGIGTSSRVLPPEQGGYIVGVLVNANHGLREELRVDGVPVGRELSDAPGRPGNGDGGSIIIVIATDAPLDSRQLSRLARRAALGLSRTGATARHGSGDLILAFSTANSVPHNPTERMRTVTLLNDDYINPLFQATIEATEEAVLNALTAAPTVVGRDGHTAPALPLDRLKEIMQKYGRLSR